jgi:hypothetical protein
LAPEGPIYVTICRYAGLNQEVRPGQLERSDVLDGSQLDGFVRYLDTTKWETVPRNGAFNCPASEGSTDILIFRYPDLSQATVSVDIGGCPFASNGQMTVWGYAIGQRLAQWVGSDSQL